MFGATTVSTGAGNGTFYVNSGVRLDDVKDGTSMTMIAGERANAISAVTWVGVHYNQNAGGSTWSPSSMTYAAQPTLVLGSADTTIAIPVSGAPVQAFGSAHRGGTHMAYADGHTKFVTSGINVALFKLLGQINDKQTIKGFDF
jgi:prepilin-type processing-associated H-X9-DG protein